jgi:hypothetical protein
MRESLTPVVLAASGRGLAPSPPPAGAPSIVDTYRKIIVLLGESGAPDENARRRREVVARYVFQENEARLSALGETLGTDPARVGAFLDVLEKDAGLHDADKLVFRDFLDDLAARLQEAPPAPATPPLLARIAEDQARCEPSGAVPEELKIRLLETRGMVAARPGEATPCSRTRVNVEAGGECARWPTRAPTRGARAAEGAGGLAAAGQDAAAHVRRRAARAPHRPSSTSSSSADQGRVLRRGQNRAR